MAPFFNLINLNCRYRTTLREYVLTYKRNYWSGRVMFGQLLEALVFLYENNVSHRDLKSDNILLDFDNESKFFRIKNV